jgi:sugar/nucleoside kinase (ribokinase family)
VIALLGNLSRDVFPGGPPRTGGAPYHGARALAELSMPARIYARCAVEDRDELLPPVVALGTPVQYVPGRATAAFEIEDEPDGRRMVLRAVGDRWLPADLPVLPDEARWAHVAPLARQDFPAETIAALARGRRVSYDGQGLVRTGRLGELELDAAYDPELLRHVWVLKLGDEEAAVLGDPAALPVREVIVTHGPRGATVYANRRVDEVPAFPLGLNATGTGDAFCVAYVAARAGGFKPVEAARRATAVVASVLAAGR